MFKIQLAPRCFEGGEEDAVADARRDRDRDPTRKGLVQATPSTRTLELRVADITISWVFADGRISI